MTVLLADLDPEAAAALARAHAALEACAVLLAVVRDGAPVFPTPEQVAATASR